MYNIQKEHDGDLYSINMSADKRSWSQLPENGYKSYVIYFENELLPAITSDLQRSGKVFCGINKLFYNAVSLLDNLNKKMNENGYTTIVSFQGDHRLTPQLSIMIIDGVFS
jgi:hypothetical protein